MPRSGFGLDELLGRIGEDARATAPSHRPRARRPRHYCKTGLDTPGAGPYRKSCTRAARTGRENSRRDHPTRQAIRGEESGGRRSNRGVELASWPAAQNIACSNAA
jgi:hypothetical protein